MKIFLCLSLVPSEADAETKIQVHEFYMGGDPGYPTERVPMWYREGKADSEESFRRGHHCGQLKQDAVETS